MKKSISFSRVGFDLFWVQLTWTFYYLGITLLVNIIRLFFGGNLDTFYSAGYISSNIYMLVIGIIAINFLPYYVENGITRKNYFLGNLIASAGLSIILPILTYFISLVEKLIVNNFTSNDLADRTLEQLVIEMDMDGNIVGEIIQSVILTPFISPESNLLLSLALFSLHIFIFYMIGWLIGSAFYRLGVIAGIIFIAIGLSFLLIKDAMIRLAMDLPLLEVVAFLESTPKVSALPIVFGVILVTVLLIRQLTKRASIKI